MVFVSVVSPTTTVWGSFVGAVGGGGGGAASSVVLQSIVSGIILFFYSLFFLTGAFFVFESKLCQETHSGGNQSCGTSLVHGNPVPLYRYGRRNQIE